MMLPLQFFGRLYSLDILDTRFTTSSKVPLQETRQEHGVNNRPAAITPKAQVEDSLVAGAQPSKWNTWEYYFYYLVFLTVVPCMFWVPYTVSRGILARSRRLCYLKAMLNHFPKNLTQNTLSSPHSCQMDGSQVAKW